VRTAQVKKVLDKMGCGWMLPSKDELEKLSPSDVRPVTLPGSFDLGFALGYYSWGRRDEIKRTPLGELLHRFKYEQNRQAGLLLVGLLCDFIRNRRSFSTCDLMITVPPSFKSRPFDPVSVLAEEMIRCTGISWYRNALRRTRLNKPQKEIRERKAKELNVLNVFQTSGHLDLNGRRVLLLDDTFDSGATLDQVCRILREARPEKIYALVVAKTKGYL
jgi:predicted amidophosphoribosyltransferase